MNNQFDIVFEGGGAKGIVFVGALKALLEQGYSYRRLVGTSAGAITAALCAAGYTPEQMLACITEKTAENKPVFSTFMDKPRREDFSASDMDNSLMAKALAAINLPFVPDRYENQFEDFLVGKLLENSLYARVFSFVERGGLYSGSTFLHWIQERLAEKGYARDITLADLYGCTEKDLSVVATDVGVREMLVLNHRTAPNLPVAVAVRMSMSIPFIWEEIIWDAAWQYHLLDGSEKPLANTRIVDGGVLSNFPMELIAEHGSTLVKQTMGNLTPEFVNAAGNLGLLIDETLAVTGQPESGRGDAALLKELPMVGRIQNLAETMMSARNNSVIDQYRNEICRLPSKGYGTLEFGMEGQRLQDFIQAGYITMQEHLATR